MLMQSYWYFSDQLTNYQQTLLNFQHVTSILIAAMLLCQCLCATKNDVKHFLPTRTLVIAF